MPTAKTLRVLLLMLLAVLLPIRGAMAAAMLCPIGASASHSEWQAQPQAGHHDHGASAHQHEHTATDKCHMCAAFCSLTPLPSEAPRLPEPVALAGVKFPALSIPAPSFLSDGQERPPRSR